ncbi:MAG TPA: aminotransferase class V-fold PLP-dependent enzyme [Bryobacteraceae bacterium]|nr:aminotransferase class V-fold PLP-dependent enzyme [Bryobacteraceae bacterium]
MGNKVRPSRRALLHAGGAGAAALLGGTPPLAAAPEPDSPRIYSRIGVKPFINLTATYTINGGALMLPEVREAMDEASRWSVNIDELMEKAGARIAEWLGAEAAIVTSGSAAALTHATAACIAGGDPERMKQLPILTGLKTDVIMPKQSRNDYDHAFRTVGARIVQVDTPHEFQEALNERTAMIAVLGVGEAQGSVRLEQIVPAARKFGVPVLVDAAAELPARPNPYLARGADLVVYSGGKFLRGPQCAGVLAGNAGLIRAAWLNSAPHHAFGRAMKAGKEEIMGMLAALDVYFHKRDVKAEYREWESWFASMSAEITRTPGVTTRVLPPAGASPYPVLEIAWDPSRVGLTAGELYRLLLDGEPRIMSHASGGGHSFILRPVAMKPEDHKLVARRLREIFAAAPKSKSVQPQISLGANPGGRWNLDITFARGAARHALQLRVQGGRLLGSHQGATAHGDVEGTISGDRIRFRSTLPVEGVRLVYTFSGAISGDAMSGELDLGEYGPAAWKASRV